MGTRSRIGLEDPETGAVRSIYCHWDGYPEGVGRELVEHYSQRDAVEQLIGLGYLSALKATLAPPRKAKHGFDNPLEGVTIAYHRDRGEPLDIDTDTDAEALYARAAEGWEEYVYLFRQGVWFYTEVGGGAGPFLVNAKDPEGTEPSRWKNLSGALQFGAAKHNPAYQIG